MANSADMTAPISSALIGVLKRRWTFEIHPDAGRAPSRLNEKASRLPAP